MYAVYGKGCDLTCLRLTRAFVKSAILPALGTRHRLPSLCNPCSGPSKPKTNCRRANCNASLSQTLQGVGSMSWLPAAGLALGLYCLWRIVRFIRSDVDGRLLSKGLAPPNAFEDKVIWITGASQGLGAELAKYFAAHGARLILSSRRAEKLQEVRQGCVGKHAPGGVLVLPLDLCGDAAELEGAASAADGAFDCAGVDFLVHNAGASQHSLAEQTSAEVVAQMFALNTVGPINLTRAALPHMLTRRRGRIVVVSSMAGLVPSPGQAIYSACKHALNGYFATLLTEVCDRGIGVTICSPGPVATGSADAPRVVYGAEGLMQTHTATSAAGSSRLRTERVAAWVGAAAYHGVEECRISKQPILALSYVRQHFPSLAMRILKKVGPSRAKRMSTGGSGYEVKGMFFGKTGGAGKSKR